VLEGSILANGCETPLIVWKGKGIIVDGHNRYRICKANGIPFAIEEKEFENEEEVMYWIVMNQIGRRNLNAYSKIEMGIHHIEASLLENIRDILNTTYDELLKRK